MGWRFPAKFCFLRLPQRSKREQWETLWRKRRSGVYFACWPFPWRVLRTWWTTSNPTLTWWALVKTSPTNACSSCYFACTQCSWCAGRDFPHPPGTKILCAQFLVLGPNDYNPSRTVRSPFRTYQFYYYAWVKRGRLWIYSTCIYTIEWW